MATKWEKKVVEPPLQRQSRKDQGLDVSHHQKDHLVVKVLNRLVV